MITIFNWKTGSYFPFYGFFCVYSFGASIIITCQKFTWPIRKRYSSCRTKVTGGVIEITHGLGGSVCTVSCRNLWIPPIIFIRGFYCIRQSNLKFKFCVYAGIRRIIIRRNHFLNTVYIYIPIFKIS